MREGKVPGHPQLLRVNHVRLPVAIHVLNLPHELGTSWIKVIGMNIGLSHAPGQRSWLEAEQLDLQIAEMGRLGHGFSGLFQAQNCALPLPDGQPPAKDAHFLPETR